MHPYQKFLGNRHALYLQSTNLLGRIPTGMGALAVAIFLRSDGVPYGLLGLGTGLYGVSAAVGGPLLGRLVDRYGQLQGLIPSAVLGCVGYLTLAVSDAAGVAVTVVSIILAGAFTPPLEPCLRSVWPDVLTDQQSLNTAYSLDAALQQLLFVVGPLAVAWIFKVSSASTVLVVAAVLTIVGTLTYAVSPPVRRWRPVDRARDWTGPLRESAILWTLLSMLLVGAAVGSLSVLSVGYAERHANTSLSGILLGAHAAGAFVGGLVYGAVAPPSSPRAQAARLVLVLSLLYWPLLIIPGPIAMAMLMAVAGIMLAPVLASSFAVIGRYSPHGTVTEAFAWITTMFMSGGAVGSGIVGGLINGPGLQAAFLVPPVAAGVAAAVLLSARQDSRITRTA